MSTLHTVNKSPYNTNTLASCLNVCDCEDAILLMEDGVFGALSQSPCAEYLSSTIAKGVKVYALESDVKARGLAERLHHEIQLTDFHNFVQLSLDYRCVQSWY